MPLDISQVLKQRNEARKQFDRMPKEVMRILSEAAELERRTHEFHNVTGLLEQNTRAQRRSLDDDPLEEELVMLRPYASNVRQRGRTDIDKRRDEAAREIEFLLDSIGLTLAAM